jgi:hypothetical protein
MIQKRYELIATDRMSPGGKLLYQLRALIDFETVRAGDFGGFVEGEHNLPHESAAWLFGNATLFGDGYIAERDFFRESAVVVPEFPILPHRPGLRPHTRRDYTNLH